MQLFLDLFGNVLNFTWQQIVMILVGSLLVFLAIKRQMERTPLLKVTLPNLADMELINKVYNENK